jgi:two-component system, OmpR family, sensor kinase
MTRLIRSSARPTRHSLRTRLVIATILLTAAVSLVIGLVSVGALKLFLEQRLDDQLTSAVRRSRLAADRPNDFANLPPFVISRNRPAGYGPGFLVAPGQGQGTLGAMIDTDGTLHAAVLDSAGTPTQLNDRQKARLVAIPVDAHPHTVDVGSGLGSYRLLAQRTSRGVLITGLPLNSVTSAVYQLAGVVLAVSVIGLLAAAIIGAVIIRRTLRPLSRVAATATQVSELPLDRGEVALAVRVPDRDTNPNTEVGQVGAALNRMLGHVGGALQARQASEARVRRFVADASHELRTPLASIRGYAELTRRSRLELPPDVAHALSRVESEAIRMTGLVEELLLLARLDEGRPSQRQSVDLSRLLVDAVSDAHAAGPDHRWRLDLPDRPVTVVGDDSQLRQIVVNLLANARVHTPAGSTVTVQLTFTEQAGPVRGERADVGGAGSAVGAQPEVVLLVIDDGPGISADLLPEVFERFARGDGSRSRGTGTGSTGLGLSIVAAVVAAHGGRVEVTSEPGRTSFAVHLPLAPATDPPPAEHPSAEDPPTEDPPTEDLPTEDLPDEDQPAEDLPREHQPS